MIPGRAGGAVARPPRDPVLRLQIAIRAHTDLSSEDLSVLVWKTIRMIAFGAKAAVDGLLLTPTTLTASLPGPAWELPSVRYLIDLQHGTPRRSWDVLRPLLEQGLADPILALFHRHLAVSLEPLSLAAERYEPIPKPPFFDKVATIYAML